MIIIKINNDAMERSMDHYAALPSSSSGLRADGVAA